MGIIIGCVSALTNASFWFPPSRGIDVNIRDKTDNAVGGSVGGRDEGEIHTDNRALYAPSRNKEPGTISKVPQFL